MDQKDDDGKPPGGKIANLRIGLLFSEVKREYFPTETQYLTEASAEKDATIIASYLKKMGAEPVLYPANAQVAQKLLHDQPDMAFNLVGSVRGSEYLASTIPALLELLEIPYTGAGILGESLGYNKFLVKKLLEQSGIPVPHCQLFNTPADPLDSILRFPVISKLNEIHGAVEINQNAVSENEKQLRERIKFLIDTYDQPVLVEEFIVGREITAMLLEGQNKKVYLAEKVFSKPQEKYVFATFEDQWLEGEEGFYYQKYRDPVLQEYVKRAFEVTKMADYGKFDIRLDAAGRYFFLDANSNPAFGPKECDCAIANILDLYGVTFEEILERIILNTMKSAGDKKNEKNS